MTGHNGQGFYIDIRNSMSLQFDDEEDFDKTSYQLSDLDLIYKNDDDTLYKLTFLELKIKYAIPRITLFYTDKDKPRFRIKGYELFDTYDDILTEQSEIDDYYITTKNTENLEIVTVCFPDNTGKDRMHNEVQRIDKKEVERLYKINNSNDFCNNMSSRRGK